MADNDDTPKPTTLPDFTPVPRQQDRADGWGADVQRAFIEALADCGSVVAACRFVGKSASSAYSLRRHPEGAEFAAAWQAAADLGIRQIEDYAMDRALNGVEVPVFAYGDKIATRRVHNESLVMFMLRNRAPERYCVDGARALSAIDEKQLARFKKQWRDEWEAERQRAEDEADKEVTSGLVEKFETMHRNWYASLSPRARAAYKEFRRTERADQAAGYRPHDDDVAEAEAEYDAGAASLDGRAKINLIIEADGYGVDEVLAEDD